MGKRHLQLRGTDPGAPDQCWESEELLRIGRLESLEVVIEDSSVSRRHAEVVSTDNGWVARDLGSTNGTFVNSVRVGRADHKLRSGDLLQCGNVKMRVAIIDEAAPEPAAGGHRVQAAVQNTWSQAVLC